MPLRLRLAAVVTLVCVFGAFQAHAQRVDSPRPFFSDPYRSSVAKPPKAKIVKRKVVRKKAPRRHAAVGAPAALDQAAIERAVRGVLTRDTALLRNAIADALQNDVKLRDMIAAPASRPEAPVLLQRGQAPVDRRRIEPIIRDYLLKNPEVLQEAIAELEKKQAVADAEKHQAAVKENADTLFNSTHQVVLGNPKGDVTFVEFFDYNCGYCKRALDDMIEIMRDDSKLKVVLKEFPVLGPNSQDAARVATAVRMQDRTGKKYLEFHQKLLTGRGAADKARALAVAREVGLDMAQIERDMASDEVRASLEESFKLAEKLGLNGTPSYVIGNEVVIGAVGGPALKAKVNTARCGKATC